MPLCSQKLYSFGYALVNLLLVKLFERFLKLNLHYNIEVHKVLYISKEIEK